MAEAVAAAEKNGPLQKLRTEEQVEIYDWLSGLGADGEIEVRLTRTFPAEWKGISTKGLLCVYDEPIDQALVKASHGGGRYKIVVRIRDGKGKWAYAGGKSFEIAGEPNLRSLVGVSDADEDSGNGATADPASSQAMNMALNLTRDAQSRADRAEDRASASSGIDWKMIEQMQAPLQRQVEAMATENSRLQTELLAKLSERPDTTSQDRLFGILDNKESTHGNALQQLRQTHDSELRQIRDFNREELKRREARFEKELDYVRSAATREVDSLKLAHAQALGSQKQGFEMRIDGMKDIGKRLEREVDSTKKELAEVRGKKELTPIDQIQSLVTLKNGFEALVPSGSTEPDKSGWERAAEMVMNSELAQGVAARIAGSGPPGAAAEEEGEQLVAVRAPDGTIRQVPLSLIQRAQAAKAAQEAKATEQGLPADAAPLDENDVAKAMAFMEAAVKNGTDPAMFARTARNMIPEAILAYVKQQGVDAFLNNVAKIPSGSPLATVAGRTWVRKVAKYLLEGTTEGVQSEAQPNSPVES